LRAIIKHNKMRGVTNCIGNVPTIIFVHTIVINKLLKIVIGCFRINIKIYHNHTKNLFICFNKRIKTKRLVMSAATRKKCLKFEDSKKNHLNNPKIVFIIKYQFTGVKTSIINFVLKI